MTRKVGVIGQGHVGETLANNLLVTGTVDELVLVDTDQKKTQRQRDGLRGRGGEPADPYPDQKE